LQKALAGRVVTGFETGFAKLASVNDNSPLVGRTVERVEARGKWCLMFFSGDLILVSHMLMSGSWHIYRTKNKDGKTEAEKWRLPHRMMRVVVRVGEVPNTFAGDEKKDSAGYEAVLFNAQIAEFHTERSLERSSAVPKLGPDVLSEEFSLERGVQALRERTRTHPEDEVGIVLLNQRVMAGLGNVYKSEVAFAAGVHPFRAMRTLTGSEMERMVEFAQRYMRANVAAGAARGESGEGIVTYTGMRRTTRSMSPGDRLWVYGRKGKECRRCGAIIEMRKQGTQARSTYWCPECQPFVASAAADARAKTSGG
jgi:endonuclease-8